MDKETANIIEATENDEDNVETTEKIVENEIDGLLDGYYVAKIKTTDTTYENYPLKAIDDMALNDNFYEKLNNGNYKYSARVSEAHKEEIGGDLSDSWNDIRKLKTDVIMSYSGQSVLSVSDGGGSLAFECFIDDEADSITIDEAIKEGYWAYRDVTPRYGFDVYKFFNYKPDNCHEYNYVQAIVKEFGNPNRVLYKDNIGISIDYLLVYNTKNNTIVFSCREMLDEDLNEVIEIDVLGKNSNYIEREYGDYTELN